jgi:hypothetical protein
MGKDVSSLFSGLRCGGEASLVTELEETESLLSESLMAMAVDEEKEDEDDEDDEEEEEKAFELSLCFRSVPFVDLLTDCDGSSGGLVLADENGLELAFTGILFLLFDESTSIVSLVVVAPTLGFLL